MSTNGETADLVVREGIQITESAVKLAGLGAKNLAALLIALANDSQKISGKTNIMLSITISTRTERRSRNGNHFPRRPKRNTARPRSSTNKAPVPSLPPAKPPLPHSLKIS